MRGQMVASSAFEYEAMSEAWYEASEGGVNELVSIMLDIR